MRLIDADALKMDLCVNTDVGTYGNFDDGSEVWFTSREVDRAVDKSPTVDVVPIKYGEWVMDTDPDDGDCRCSNCHVCIEALHYRNHRKLELLGYKLHTFYKFCPNCGAKMSTK